LRQPPNATPRFALQQILAKAARKAEQSDVKFLTEEELTAVESLLG
jgi:hypothetical protein